jgi:hypothetical protein
VRAERTYASRRKVVAGAGHQGDGVVRYGLAALLLLVALVTDLGALGALIEAHHLWQVTRHQGLPTL